MVNQVLMQFKARKALHHTQVIHSQLRGLSAADVAKMVEKNPRTIIHYLYALGYCGRAARRKPLLCPFIVEYRKQWESEMISKPLEFWDIIVFSDES